MTPTGPSCIRRLHCLAALSLAILLAACGAPATPAAPPPVQLEVIAPDGVAPRLTLLGSDGFALPVEGTADLDVPPGDYRLVAEAVAANGTLYLPSPSEIAIRVHADGSVAPSGGPTIVIEYRTLDDAGPPGTGSGPTDAIDGVPPMPVRPGSTAYHLDCAAGDDAAAGTSPDTAWRSLARLRGLALRPGDRVLLLRGCTWTGPLHVPWEGSAAWPVVVSAYGSGPRPAIRDSNANHVDISGSHLVVEHLRAYTTPGSVPTDPGCRHQPVAWRTGFTLQGGARHVTLRFVQAHGNTAGVHVTRDASHNRIIHSDLFDNVIMSVNTPGGDDDSGAWGIVLNGSDNEIGYNRFWGNTAWCSYDYRQEGASIEVYEAQRNVIHHNVSVGDGTFSEIGSSRSRRSVDTLVAFNRYVSDAPVSEFLVLRGAGAHFGPTPRTRVFHNTVYLTGRERSQGVVCYAGCTGDILELRNNVIWAEWKGIYVDRPFAESNNVFWRADGRPLLQFFGSGNEMSRTSMVADPGFVDAVGGDFRPRPGSPASGAGAALALPFTRDLDGRSLFAGAPTIGAHGVAAP